MAAHGQNNDLLSGGWVKLHRNLLYDTIWINSTLEQRVILITLLCMANHAPKKWEWQGKPYVLQEGQFITSAQSIIDKCRCKEITRQKVRTALERFKNLGFLTIETTKQNTLITIVNWSVYQSFECDNNQQNNQRLTNNQPMNNQRLTTNKNIKNNKNVKNYIYIVEYLNTKAGTSYKPDCKKTQSLIQARINEGYSLDDFKRVIDVKCSEWRYDKKMCKYIRPETLFGTKFESYLNQDFVTTNKTIDEPHWEKGVLCL